MPTNGGIRKGDYLKSVFVLIISAWRRPAKPVRAKRGGVEESRTPDLCSAIAALYQLSYDPAARDYGGAR